MENKRLEEIKARWQGLPEGESLPEADIEWLLKEAEERGIMNENQAKLIGHLEDEIKELRQNVKKKPVNPLNSLDLRPPDRNVSAPEKREMEFKFE
ncbi:MAG: hypothetical protein JSU85_04925 [Candidatus Zixiibacteriota bacterium]|nr:MAG: hypothetical protein JSU85_04925 [candidate division Zixibacteria bacterium]